MATAVDLELLKQRLNRLGVDVATLHAPVGAAAAAEGHTSTTLLANPAGAGPSQASTASVLCRARARGALLASAMGPPWPCLHTHHVRACVRACASGGNNRERCVVHR